MSTANEMKDLVGKTALFTTDKMQFDVEIHDVRSNFGRTDFYVKPVSGRGETWVSADRLAIQ